MTKEDFSLFVRVLAHEAGFSLSEEQAELVWKACQEAKKDPNNFINTYKPKEITMDFLEDE